jgi:hypothetical protein
MTQQEVDHHRRADDGGFIPSPERPEAAVVTRTPWLIIGIASALGFTIGWCIASSAAPPSLRSKPTRR